jgi:hypothetical protein
MYIIPHLYVVKDFWNSKILNQFWKVFKFLNFQYEFFFNVPNRSLSSWIFSLEFFKYYMNFFMVLCKINSFWHNRLSLSKTLNQNLKLKFHQMNQWKRNNLPWLPCFLMVKHKYSKLIVFLCPPTPFSTHLIVITPL